MENQIPSHVHQIIGLVVAAGAVFLLWSWMLGREKGPQLLSSRTRITVFCKQCNWEGVVRRDAALCARCRSSNLGVITT